LPRAQRFYEDTLGLKPAANYGFAKIYQVSRSSFLGLVDEKEGMHRAAEPKTVTLSFVTEEVDGWYRYLVDKGVQTRGPLKDATRHPTRGFVAYDPEGYFLEFERFLEDSKNELFLSKLKNVKPLYSDEMRASGRPKDLGVQANIIWLYYKDLAGAQKFYEEILGFQLLVDQGFAKVYSCSTSGFIGLVDEAQGLHRFSDEKAVTVSFLTAEIEKWHSSLKEKGLKMHSPLEGPGRVPVRSFVTYDEAGYFLEFDEFLDHQKNATLLRLLKK
jgi:catechol 2,3-dioxygenase-like lactoylglutathione lyase family enzyme